MLPTALQVLSCPALVDMSSQLLSQSVRASVQRPRTVRTQARMASAGGLFGGLLRRKKPKPKQREELKTEVGALVVCCCVCVV